MKLHIPYITLHLRHITPPMRRIKLHPPQNSMDNILLKNNNHRSSMKLINHKNGVIPEIYGITGLNR